jgi:hypothetical protein
MMFLLGVLHLAVVRYSGVSEEHEHLTTTCYRRPKEKHHLIISSCENLKTYTITYSVVTHKSYKVGTVLFYHVNNSPNTGLYPQADKYYIYRTQGSDFPLNLALKYKVVLN